MSVFKYTNRITSVSQYLLASLVPLVLNLASNPFVAMNMSPEDYAIVGYYKSFNTLILPLILFYVLHYYTKRYYELNEENRLKLKASVFKFLIVASFMISLLCFIGVCVYTIFFNKDSQIPLLPYAAINVFSLPLTGIYSMTLIDYRMSRRSKNFLGLSVSYSVISIALLILLVVIVKWGAFGNLSSIFVVNSLFFIICCKKNKELFHIPVDKVQIKEMVLFCWPLTLAAMLGFFSNGYDRVYLERLGNVTELGYYVVAFSIAQHISVFSSAVGSTFQPDIYKSIATRSVKKYFQYIGVVLAANVLTVIIFIPFAPFVIDILTAGRYLESTGYVQIMAVSVFASAVYFAISQFTIALGFTKITLYNNIFTSILCIIMFKFIISGWQFNGAAWGLSLTYVISSFGNLLFLFLNKKSFIQKWNTPAS